jgi:hypothetical protein
MRKGRLLVVGLLGMTSWLTLPVAHAAETKLHADLLGTEEVGGGDPAGKGTADITLDDATNKVCYEFHYKADGKPTAAHIHAGAKGVSGPPVVDFNMPTNGDKGCVGSDATTLGKIRDNPAGYYVNIHTDKYPKGAIRGQLAKA